MNNKSYWTEHHRLQKLINECNIFLGCSLASDQHGASSISDPTHRQRRIAAATQIKKSALSRLASLHAKRQIGWIHAKQINAQDYDEICNSSFFDPVKRASKGPKRDIIQLRNSRNSRCRTIASMHKCAIDYYTNPGGIFNLNQQLTPEARSSRDKLLNALRDDNKTLPGHVSSSLTVDNILTTERVLTAIKTLPSGSSPGSDGIPNEFWKKYAKTTRSEEGDMIPNLFTHTIRNALVEARLSEITVSLVK